MEMRFPTHLGQWVPVPTASLGLTPGHVDAWAQEVARRMASARGDSAPSPDLIARTRALYPAPEGPNRFIFIHRRGSHGAYVDFAVGPAVEGWRERQVEEWSRGPVPIRPIEVDDLDLAPLADGFRFVMATRVDDRLDIRVAFAGLVLGTVVTAVGECWDARTMAALAVALPEFIAAMSFDATAPVPSS